MKFIFLGGKGGVGKTSASSAIALRYAQSGKKTLVISTDPAHSLSDCLDQEIGHDIVKVRKADNLWGLEIDTEQATREYGNLFFQQQGESEEGKIVQQLLGGEDLSGLTPPGADETIAFLKIIEFIENPVDFEVVVFDTAPTGHTLKLLSLPELTSNWIYKMVKIRKRISSTMEGIKRIFGGSKEKRPDLEASIEEVKKRIEIARKHLQNPEETEFIPITIPTLMSVWETERLLEALKRYQIHVNHIVINQVNPPNPTCEYCTIRNKQQMSVIEEIKELYSDEYKIHIIEMQKQEIQGIEQLQEFAKYFDFLFT